MNLKRCYGLRASSILQAWATCTGARAACELLPCSQTNMQHCKHESSLHNSADADQRGSIHTPSMHALRTSACSSPCYGSWDHEGSSTPTTLCIEDDVVSRPWGKDGRVSGRARSWTQLSQLTSQHRVLVPHYINCRRTRLLATVGACGCACVDGEVTILFNAVADGGP